MNISRDTGNSEAEVAAEVERLRDRIKELEDSLERVREEEETLREILNAASDGILAVDVNGRVVFANKRFARMWRIPPDLMDSGEDEELLNFVVSQLNEPEKFLAKVRALYQSVAEDFDMLYFRDGRVFERYSQPFLKGGTVAGRVWNFRDITGRARAQGGKS